MILRAAWGVWTLGERGAEGRAAAAGAAAGAEAEAEAWCALPGALGFAVRHISQTWLRGALSKVQLVQDQVMAAGARRGP